MKEDWCVVAKDMKAWCREGVEVANEHTEVK